MIIKSIEDLRISDCCSILHIKQDNVLVELIDFQASDKEQQAVLNQLKILLKKDKVAYENCVGLTDYITYIDEWYDGLYVSLAKESIKRLKQDEHSSVKKKPISPKRPLIATFFIYILLIGSAISFIACLPGSFWSIGLLDDPEWSGINVYGKGIIPGCLISLTVLIGNISIIRRKCSGFWFMSIMSLILVIPTILNDYEEVLYFSIPLGCSLLIYYIILHIKQNGNTAWDMMEKSPSLKKIAIYFWVLYLVLVLLTPPILSMSFGFKSNHFDNGITIFSARWGDSKSYYSNKLANKLSSESDGIGVVYEYDIKKWHERATMYSEDWQEYVYFEYADYLISIGEHKNAYRVLKDANGKYHNNETIEKLNQFVSEYGSF